MARKFLLTTLAYLIPTMILGLVWHFVFFEGLYASLGIYNRVEPIIPLGFASMVIQGSIMAYLFPFFYREGNAPLQAMKFSLVMGLFMFTVSTLANAAKIEVTSMTSWITVQFAFHFVQFVLVGAGIGLVYRK